MDKEYLYMQKLAGIITEGEYRQKLEEGWKDVLAGGMLALATILPQTADAQDGRVELETINDTITDIMVSKGLDRDTVKKITSTAYNLYRNRKGDVKKIVADIKTEYTYPNSKDIDSTRTSTEQETSVKDPKTGKIITLASDGELEVEGKLMRDPETIKQLVANIKDLEKKKEAEGKLKGYTREYNRLRRLVK